jgi:hypothetical protein
VPRPRRGARRPRPRMTGEARRSAPPPRAALQNGPTVATARQDKIGGRLVDAPPRQGPSLQELNRRGVPGRGRWMDRDRDLLARGAGRRAVHAERPAAGNAREERHARSRVPDRIAAAFRSLGGAEEPDVQHRRGGPERLVQVREDCDRDLRPVLRLRGAASPARSGTIRRRSRVGARRMHERRSGERASSNGSPLVYDGVTIAAWTGPGRSHRATARGTAERFP